MGAAPVCGRSRDEHPNMGSLTILLAKQQMVWTTAHWEGETSSRGASAHSGRGLEGALEGGNCGNYRVPHFPSLVRYLVIYGVGMQNVMRVTGCPMQGKVARVQPAPPLLGPVSHRSTSSRRCTVTGDVDWGAWTPLAPPSWM